MKLGTRTAKRFRICATSSFRRPTSRVAALLDDLHDRGLLESTLIVMAGEFGRTPRISHLPQFYKLPGRDHWGAVQTVFFAGGGTRGGTVVGSSDKIGGFSGEQSQRRRRIWQPRSTSRSVCRKRWPGATRRAARIRSIEAPRSANSS